LSGAVRELSLRVLACFPPIPIQNDEDRLSVVSDSEMAMVSQKKALSGVT
jgi:hypothetical protein